MRGSCITDYNWLAKIASPVKVMRHCYLLCRPLFDQTTHCIALRFYYLPEMNSQKAYNIIYKIMYHPSKFTPLVNISDQASHLPPTLSPCICSTFCITGYISLGTRLRVNIATFLIACMQVHTLADNEAKSKMMGY